MNKTLQIAALYLSTLRGMTIIHSHNHWTTKGQNFYENHLLFERIYNSAIEDLDLAAEKFVGLFGSDCLNYELNTNLLNKVLLKYKDGSDSPIKMSLGIEEDFLKLSSQAYEAFEEASVLSLGLDDMISSIASNRESSVYLLKQNLK